MGEQEVRTEKAGNMAVAVEIHAAAKHRMVGKNRGNCEGDYVSTRCQSRLRENHIIQCYVPLCSIEQRTDSWKKRSAGDNRNEMLRLILGVRLEDRKQNEDFHHLIIVACINEMTLAARL